MDHHRKVDVGPHRTTKRYESRDRARWEVALYQLVPWACPPLLDYDETTLVIETRPVAKHHPDWKPIDETLALLHRLHGAGVMHRDVHVGNIVDCDGPRLIDWEHALVGEFAVSLDLEGPEVSALPEPTPGWPTLWWGADHEWSPTVFWKVTDG